jgi:hypothetical protein
VVVVAVLVGIVAPQEAEQVVMLTTQKTPQEVEVVLGY